jgi:nicotinate-nucleotide pyrophosphorylase (carboxylating)
MSPSMNESAIRECQTLVRLALAEDLGANFQYGAGDITSCAVVPERATGSAVFLARDSGVICGVAVLPFVLQIANCGLELETKVSDGAIVQRGDIVARLSGNAREILFVERTCLNFLGRLSGIATLTSRFVSRVSGTSATVLDTRKTTPGWRSLEKHAVSCGGGINHRMGLFDAILVKDNHLALMDVLADEPYAEITIAVESARNWIRDHADSLPNGKRTIVEIEVDRLEQFERALAAGPDIILLDNMSCEGMAAAVDRRNAIRSRTLLEASGGVNLNTIRAVAETGVDRISVGALTHSAVNFDIGLDWERGS